MPRLAYDPARQVLLVDFGAALTAETIEACDRAMERFVARHGETDLIVDFSGVQGTFSTAPVESRAKRPPAIAHRKRVFVAPTDQLYGSLRIYLAYQQPPPMLVRTLGEALAFIGAPVPDFRPLDI